MPHSTPRLPAKADAEKGRPRPPIFLALGGQSAPEEIEIEGETFRLEELLKHDSWAATALYRGERKRVVCKFNRQQPVLGFPMKWLGNLLAARESRRLEQFDDLARIPAACGNVLVKGVHQPHATAHDYVEGRPLIAREKMPDSFFDELESTLRSMHERGVAYVDLHKPENVIVDPEGRPYLIDFQISFGKPNGVLGRCWPITWIFQILVESDLYHLRKHRLSDLRSGLSDREFLVRVNVPWWIRLHRLFAEPLRTIRRRGLVLLGIRRGGGQAKSENKPEKAVQLELAQVDQLQGRVDQAA